MAASLSWLLTILQSRGLSPRLRLGPEDRICIPFANMLRAAALEGRLRAVFVHPANELAGAAKATPRAALARALGLMPGAADYLFLAEDGSLALEAKAERGSMSEAQKTFRRWCELCGVRYAVFRSVEEGEALLIEAGLLLPRLAA